MKKIIVTGCNGQLGRAIRKEYGDTVDFINTDVIDGDGITNGICKKRICRPGL